MEQEESEVWFRTDTFIEISDSLRFTEMMLARFPDDLASFKWVVLGSVLVLQGACIFQLDGHDTTLTSTLSDHSRKKIIEHLHNPTGKIFPNERLATPSELLSRVKQPHQTSNDFSSSWDSDDVANCEHLIMLRNEFIHFLPQGWSHCLVGFPASLSSCWKIVHVLLSSPIEYRHRVPEGLLQEMLARVDTVRVRIAELESIF